MPVCPYAKLGLAYQMLVVKMPATIDSGTRISCSACWISGWCVFLRDELLCKVNRFWIIWICFASMNKDLRIGVDWSQFRIRSRFVIFKNLQFDWFQRANYIWKIRWKLIWIQFVRFYSNFRVGLNFQKLNSFQIRWFWLENLQFVEIERWKNIQKFDNNQFEIYSIRLHLYAVAAQALKYWWGSRGYIFLGWFLLHIWAIWGNDPY